jgi:Reverse transcriptase (RNA-dependent DNA polymerase)
VDYKIISKVLTNRLKLVVDKVVSIEQTCGIAGRSIFDNLHFLRNVYDYCRQRKIPCIFLSFDQAKAFDSVGHSYLFRVLELMGFGLSFIKWDSLLYTDIYSCVLVNRFLTNPFLISRSVRQGCGLSPLLYAICSNL